MRLPTRPCLALLLVAAAAGAAAQDPAGEERPAVAVPLRPRTRQELAQREARALYGLGLMRQNQDRLLEALRLFEQALRLDPEAAPLYQAVIPLYFALGRTADGLAACRKAVDLDPGDYQTWSTYARQLKGQGRLKEARNALKRAAACRGLAEHPDLRAQLLFDLGVLCEELRDYDPAVAAFREVVALLEDPHGLAESGSFDRAALQEQAAGIYERLVKLCIEARQYDRAREIFAAAQQKHPALARRLNYHLAKVELAEGRPTQALEYLDAYLTTQPPGAEAYELRGTVLRQLHRSAEIVPALQAYAEKDARNVALRLLLARESADAGQAKVAEEIYQKLAEQTPTVEIYRSLFRLYQHGGQMDRVLSLLDDAIRRSAPSGPGGQEGDPQAAAKARAMLQALRDATDLARDLVPLALPAVGPGRPLHPQTRFFLAVFAARTGQLDEAEQFYRACLAEYNGNDQRQQAVYGGLIDVLEQGHKYEALVEVCRHGLKHAKATHRVLFHYTLSVALAALGRNDEAVAEADKAVELADPANLLGMRLNRISILAQAERFLQAVAEGKALLKEFTQPGEVKRIRYRLASVYAARRDFRRAEELLRLVLRDDPNDSQACNDLGYFWADQGKNLEEAEHLIRKAIDLDRQQDSSLRTDEANAAYLDSLGWVLFRRGQLAEARRWLEKAVAAAGTVGDPTIWDHLGDVCARLGDAARARSAWHKAVELYDKEPGRRKDEPYKELKHKLQLFESAGQLP